MALGVIVGGARSGKSRLATALAAATARPVVFVATGEARDGEMADRIAGHRRDRPAGWATVEEPVELGGALHRSPADACVLVDCLSLWVANLMGAGWDDERIDAESGRVAALAAARDAPTIAVTNEVGMAIVPDNALARRYRDVLGTVNATWAEAAAWSAFTIAGQLLELRDPSAALDDLVARIDVG